MSQLPANAALAALRYWTAQVGAGAEVWASPEQQALACEAAWLVVGTSAAKEQLPTLDLTQPLESIFSRIQPKGGTAKLAQSYIRRSSLALDEHTLFPIQSEAESLSSASDPIKALGRARADLERRLLSEQAELAGLLYAMQRHAWCLPSPLDAVSLYDFARTHAAVAAAQALHLGDLFLLGGDLSGVQRFLYTLTAAGATKQLRGRSFYLQLLTEACAHFVLNAAGLPLTNILYSGGGRFYLVLPNQIAGTPTAQWVGELRSTFDSFFLHQHQGDLYLALGGDLLRKEDLFSPDLFRSAWGRATEQINAAKRRRFATMGSAVFEPLGHGGNEDVTCVICGYQGEPIDFAKQDEDRPGRRCVLCDSFEDLGRLLHNAEYLIVHHLEPMPSEPSRHQQRWEQLLNHLGMQVQISGAHARLGERGNRDPDRLVRWSAALALADRGNRPEVTAPVVDGYRPVANTTPTMQPADMNDWKAQADSERPPRVGDVKPFNVMVEQSKGIKRLGVLRMDVDDLGDLFRYRLDSGLARVSALSAALALFFEGWVGQLCNQTNAQAQTDPDGPSSVYTIYSGGDDLFVVGSWHLLPTLARRISDDLARYTGGHPNIHVSAGISLHGAKFPLYQAAEAADEELKRAKQRKDKAALGWLDQVVAWEHAPQLFTLVDELHGFLREPPQLSRAILQTLQQLYVQYAQDLKIARSNTKVARRDPDKLYYGPWVWLRMYQLSRVANQVNKEHPEVKEWVKRLRDSMLDGSTFPANTGGRAIERVGLAARWVQLLVRKEQG